MSYVKKISLVICAVFGLGFAVGPLAIAKDVTTDEKAKAASLAMVHDVGAEAVNTLVAAYRHFDPATFNPRVGSGFLPDRAAFIRATSDNYVKAALLEFNCFVDTVALNGFKLAVGIHWEKKIQLFGSKEPVLSQGKAELVFQGVPKSWQLVGVKGDNPF
jgi:hypothetical protein